MIFDYKNCIVSQKEIEEIVKKIFSYLDEIKEKRSFEYNFPESFIFLPEDEKILDEINRTAESFKDFDNFILIGIGGSNLGALAVYSALKHKTKKEIIFVETFDFLVLKEALEKIEKEKTALILISKSGETLESLINFEILKNKLESIDKDWKEKIIIITDEGSKLSFYAQKENLKVLFTPQKVSGRFSFLTPVGLLPLKLVGFEIEKLLEGAKEINSISLEKNFENNYPLISASIVYHHYLNKLNIYNFFLFLPQLEDLGNFCRQLISESLGKEGQGITPLVSIGTRDLHSMYQLFVDGPKDKFTNFVFVENVEDDYLLTNFELELTKKFENKNYHQLMKSIYSAVKKSYQNLNLPFFEIILENLNEKEIGALMQMKMLETIFLGKLMNINPFNQPGVEHYKREILG
jgi:glucose-6-phosphate isomerase